MDKKIWIAIGLIIVISVVSLGISIAGFLQATTEKIEIVEPKVPMESVGFEGPIYTGTSNGYLLVFENGVTYYLAGDTCLFAGMKFIIGDYYKPDIAFLPIGNFYTMDSKDAAYATTLINPKFVVPYHYHSFAEMTQNASEFVAGVNEFRDRGETRAEPVVLEYGVWRELMGIKFLWMGHASFLIESVNGTRILIDPWLEANPDCPAEYKDYTALDDIDLILVTHGHVDHVTVDELEKIVKLYDPVVLAQWELAEYLDDRITAPVTIVPFNKGGRVTKENLIRWSYGDEEFIKKIEGMDANIKITLVHADHSSSPAFGY